jgi:hypothetical protein
VINLNLGGLIGALAPLAIGLVCIFVFIVPSHNENAMTWAIQSMVAALVCFAIIGNYLWSKLVNRKSSNDVPEEKTSR